MPVALKGATSGQVTIQVPAVAGTNTLTVPAVTGNLISDQDSGTVTPTMLSQKLTLMTSVASTSGTAIDFTGIPSWVKRITVMFNGVSLSSTSPYLIQIGAGSITTSGYASSTLFSLNSAMNTGGSTAGFIMYTDSNAATLAGGFVQIVTIGSNTWVASGSVSLSASEFSTCAGRVSLSGTLDRVRITSVSGTDTFDAGSINVMYEG